MEYDITESGITVATIMLDPVWRYVFVEPHKLQSSMEMIAIAGLENTSLLGLMSAGEESFFSLISALNVHLSSNWVAVLLLASFMIDVQVVCKWTSLSLLHRDFLILAQSTSQAVISSGRLIPLAVRRVALPFSTLGCHSLQEGR